MQESKENTNNIETQSPQPQELKPQKEKKRRWLDLTISGFIVFLRHRFDLNEDKAEQDEVVGNICKSVEFRGTNLWILMFAIVVASVGLNVNSTAVIIGAMLISPLMGPIMGIGLSLGINDLDLFKRSLRNFAFAVVVSLIVSTLYFMITPLNLVQSELLSRTTPTIWDVLIATFGGLAGIVAQSRKDRTSTVIPGVAIATALMPPLCTAGFGLASGDIQYFIGALYLFFINAVCIAFATFFIVRFLKYKRVKQEGALNTKRVNRIMATVLVVTVVPSVLMGYSIVQRTIYESSAQEYLSKVFIFEGSEVVNSTVRYKTPENGNIIEVVMVGEPLSSDAIQAAKNQLKFFSLEDTQLFVRQAESGDEIDQATMTSVLKSNALIIDEKNLVIKELEAKLKTYDNDTLPRRAIARELGALWSEIESVELSRAQVLSASGQYEGKKVVCLLQLKQGATINAEGAKKLKQWLEERTSNSVRLVINESTESSEVQDSVAKASNVLMVE